MKTICIDPGHGGKDSGALGPSGLREKDVALTVALLLATELSRDAKIVLTRENDVFVELSERAAIANRAGADFFLSVHCNSGEPGSGEGFEVYTTPGLTAAAASNNLQFASSGTPLVVVRFDRPNVDYQQVLYAALNQALQSRPNANFQVVAVSPTRGNAASVQMAQTTARRHAQDVMRSMTDMGVPASRMNVASSTDPAAAASEVRVFIR